MSGNPLENIFDLQTEFPDINFDTIDPNKAEEEFHFKIASRFATAWNLKGIFCTPSDQMDVSPSAENCLRIIEMTVIQILNAAGYPIAIDAQLDDIRREIHKQLSCYIIMKKQCNLDQTPGKRLDTLLLSYSALNLAESVRFSIDNKDIDGIVIYTLNLAEDLAKLINRYGKHIFGKRRGESITDEAEALHNRIIEADSEFRIKHPTMTQRSRANLIGQKLGIPTETVRTHLKKVNRVG